MSRRMSYAAGGPEDMGWEQKTEARNTKKALYSEDKGQLGDVRDRREASSVEMKGFEAFPPQASKIQKLGIRSPRAYKRLAAKVLIKSGAGEKIHHGFSFWWPFNSTVPSLQAGSPRTPHKSRLNPVRPSSSLLSPQTHLHHPSPELKAEATEGADIALSTFFDLSLFTYSTQTPSIEWRSVKSPSGTDEQLSCWGWRDEAPLSRYSIRTDFFPPPSQSAAPVDSSTSLTISDIEQLSKESPSVWLAHTVGRYYEGVAPPFPDQQLLCFDNLYYCPSEKAVLSGDENSYSLQELDPSDPVWDQVGQYLHFNNFMDRITDEFISSLLGSKSKSFISVHISGELEDEDGEPVYTIQSLVKAFVNEVKELKKYSSALRGVGRKNMPVVFTTDSGDPALLQELAKEGWVYIDHREFATVTRFGAWYPAMLDAARRVESWTGGDSRIVE
ncbi:hypothetical protein P7C70_g5191, partial [Phenoliferia sp. Uapishka_3]